MKSCGLIIRQQEHNIVLSIQSITLYRDYQLPTINYKIHEVSPYINWIYFFHAWGFQPKFAAIANIHGCDSCRAMWLAAFPQEERSKAAEAMQLFKEAGRVLNR